MDMKMNAVNHGENPILAMAFVAFQPLDTVYETEEAFMNGTLFPSLNKPWREIGSK